MAQIAALVVSGTLLLSIVTMGPFAVGGWHYYPLAALTAASSFVGTATSGSVERDSGARMSDGTCVWQVDSGPSLDTVRMVPLAMNTDACEEVVVILHEHGQPGPQTVGAP